MFKLFLTVFGVLLFSNKSTQSIIQPTCNGGNSIDYIKPCCLQVNQIIALTLASTEASTEATAAAFATASAASSAIVAVSVAASAAAHISIQQSISLSVNPGECCEISASINSSVSAYAEAIAKASAEALAIAEASAKAAAASKTAALAGAEVYAKAQSLVKSPDSYNTSCCQFAEELLSIVEITGKFVVDSAGIADAVAEVAVYVKELAKACSDAYAAAFNQSSSALQSSIDNCCVPSNINKVANQTASSFSKALSLSDELHGLTVSALELIGSTVSEANSYKIPMTLVDSICNSDCAAVPTSCCDSNVKCCPHESRSVCMVSRNFAQVFIHVNVATETIANATIFAESMVYSASEAASAAYSAVKAASYATLSITVKNVTCCRIQVEIRGAVASHASVVSAAIAKAKSAAEAHSRGYAVAVAIADALANATASATSASTHYRNEALCCGTKCFKPIANFVSSSSCCDVIRLAINSFESQTMHDVVNSIKQVSAISAQSDMATTFKSIKTSATKTIAQDAIKQYTFDLKCCCCNTKQVKNSFGFKGISASNSMIKESLQNKSSTQDNFLKYLKPFLKYEFEN